MRGNETSEYGGEHKARSKAKGFDSLYRFISVNYGGNEKEKGATEKKEEGVEEQAKKGPTTPLEKCGAKLEARGAGGVRTLNNYLTANECSEARRAGKTDGKPEAGRTEAGKSPTHPTESQKAGPAPNTERSTPYAFTGPTVRAADEGVERGGRGGAEGAGRLAVAPEGFKEQRGEARLPGAGGGDERGASVPLTPGGFRVVRELLEGAGDAEATEVLREVAGSHPDKYAARVAAFLLGDVGLQPGLRASQLAEAMELLWSKSGLLSRGVVVPDYVADKCRKLSNDEKSLLKEKVSFWDLFTRIHGIPEVALEKMFSVLGEDLRGKVSIDKGRPGRCVIVRGRSEIFERIMEKGFDPWRLSSVIGAPRTTIQYALMIAGPDVIDEVCRLLGLTRFEVDRDKAKASILTALHAVLKSEPPARGEWRLFEAMVSVDGFVARRVNVGGKTINVIADLGRRYEPTDKKFVDETVRDIFRRMDLKSSSIKEGGIEELYSYLAGKSRTLSGQGLIKLIILSAHFTPDRTERLAASFRDAGTDRRAPVEGVVKVRVEAHPLRQVLDALVRGKGTTDEVLEALARKAGDVARVAKALTSALSGLSAREAAEILSSAIKEKPDVLLSRRPVPENVLEACFKLRQADKMKIKEGLGLNKPEYLMLMGRAIMPAEAFEALVKALGVEGKLEAKQYTARSGRKLVEILRGREELARRVMGLKGEMDELVEKVGERAKYIVPLINPEKLYSLCRTLGLPTEAAMDDEMLRTTLLRALVRREATHRVEPPVDGEWRVFTVPVDVKDGVATKIGDLKANIPLMTRLTVDNEKFMRLVEDVSEVVGGKWKFGMEPYRKAGLGFIIDHYELIEKRSTRETKVTGESVVRLTAFLLKVAPEKAESALGIVREVRAGDSSLEAAGLSVAGAAEPQPRYVDMKPGRLVTFLLPILTDEYGKAEVRIVVDERGEYRIADLVYPMLDYDAITKGENQFRHTLARIMETYFGSVNPPPSPMLLEVKSVDDKLADREAFIAIAERIIAQRRHGKYGERMVPAVLCETNIVASPLKDAMENPLKTFTYEGKPEIKFTCLAEPQEDGYYLVEMKVEGMEPVKFVLAYAPQMKVEPGNSLALAFTDTAMVNEAKKRDARKRMDKIRTECLIYLYERSEYAANQYYNFCRSRGWLRMFDYEEFSKMIKERPSTEKIVGLLQYLKMLNSLNDFYKLAVEVINEKIEYVTPRITQILELAPQEYRKELATLAAEKLAPEQLAEKLPELAKLLPDIDSKLNLVLGAADRLSPGQLADVVARLAASLPDIDSKLNLVLGAADRLSPGQLADVVARLAASLPDIDSKLNLVLGAADRLSPGQ
ncbi:MAG: hypothetical protein QXH00_03205, partial [Candidatus Jordarchaeales archaeon]